MTAPVWLIAGREFRAYAATASFWVALAIGPLLMGGALLLTGSQPGPKAAGPATLTLSASANGAEVRFSKDFPLTDAGRMAVIRTLEQNGVAGPVRLAAAPPKTKIDAGALSRFALMLMLWMTLTGSLGMLLQAVVRERSNRALESLLAAARPIDIVLGKLIGVGAVSVLVLGAWLGSSAALSALVPASGGALAPMLHGLSAPLTLLRAAAIYLLAFGFYGLTTVAVGAMARDNADAQNLARPMFAVLLAVFFTAMAAAGGARDLSWLAYVPPFTPFMLLISPQNPAVEVIAVACLGLATLVAGVFAVNALSFSSATSSVRAWIPTVRKT
jgi:ABC-2 type transport system permease protein